MKTYEALVTCKKVTIHLKNGTFVTGVITRLNPHRVTLLGYDGQNTGLFVVELSTITYVYDREHDKVAYY